MEGSVSSFLKTERKVSDTGSAHWASSFIGRNICLGLYPGLIYSIKDNATIGVHVPGFEAKEIF